jgi:hypothetical protein
MSLFALIKDFGLIWVKKLRRLDPLNSVIGLIKNKTVFTDWKYSKYFSLKILLTIKKSILWIMAKKTYSRKNILNSFHFKEYLKLFIFSFGIKSI